MYVYSSKLRIPVYGSGPLAYERWKRDFLRAYPTLISYQHRTPTGLLAPTCGLPAGVLSRVNMWLETPDWLDTPCAYREDSSFETVWGGFSNSSVVYKNSDNNVSMAMRRTTIEHTPGPLLAAGVSLANNQIRNLKTRRMRRYQQALKRWCQEVVDRSPLDFFEELILYASDKTHPKWKIRLQALLEVESLGLWSHETWLLHPIKCKLKKYERAKPGKYPRLIGDLGVVASLAAGFAWSKFKECLSTFEYSSKHPMKFVKSPSYAALKEVFEGLANPLYTYFCCHSDDSCFAARCRDGVIRVNIDIVSCDASHSGDAFRFLEGCIPDGPWKEQISRAIKQCTAPVVVKGPSGSKVTLKLVDQTEHATKDTRVYSHVLSSGSSATTSINSNQSMSIGHQLSRVEWWKLSKAEAAVEIERAALRAGYAVTVQVCEELQQLQFLKCSPNSHCEPWMNLGVMMRVLGHCFGPLPGPGTIRERANAIDKQLVAGMVHCGNSLFYRTLVEKHRPGNEVLFHSDGIKNVYLCDEPTASLDANSIATVMQELVNLSKQGLS